MPIKLGTSSLSPVTSDIAQYATDRLPISASNGEFIYCQDGNGMTVPNTTPVYGSYAYRKDGAWIKTDNTNLVANAGSLWSGAFAQFDPTAAGNGPFNPTIISDTTAGGVRRQQIYIDITFAGLTFNIYIIYRVPTSTPPVGGFPCLFTASGWQQGPQEFPSYNTAGWATFGFDYAGQKDDGSPCTNYPSALAYGRHLTSQGGYQINTTLQDGSQISDPRQTSEYLWHSVMRRAFEFLVTQPEINVNQIGMRGHSSPTSEAMAKYARVPILLINGSADHHGGHDRVDDTFDKISPGVPWDFSHDANKGHNVSINVGNELLWLNKYVLGSAITWPKRPASWLSKVSGTCQFNVQPDTTLPISSVEFWKAEVEPFNVSRVWSSVATTNDGRTWIGSMPVADNAKYLFAYANIIYTNGVVTSTRFNAVIPNKLN